MALETIARLMGDARRGEYAVGYFESWNLDSLQGVIDAAEQTRSPVIIGFNGEFLSQRAGARPEDVSVYGALGKAIADRARGPELQARTRSILRARFESGYGGKIPLAQYRGIALVHTQMPELFVAPPRWESGAHARLVTGYTSRLLDLRVLIVLVRDRVRFPVSNALVPFSGPVFLRSVNPQKSLDVGTVM
jgi:hypothetical protein